MPQGKVTLPHVGTVVAKTEFKCPYPPPSDCYYKLPVYYDLPKHYALQVIVEMEAEPRVPELLFACYSKESTVISRVKFDNELWMLAKTEVKNMLSLIKEKKMSKKRTALARDLLPKKIKEFLDNCVEVLIEVPSVTDESIETSTLPESNPHYSPYIFPTSLHHDIQQAGIKDLIECVGQLKDAINLWYQLSRRKAKELFVCLLSSAKRAYDSEMPLFFPIFYGAKGKTFSNCKKRRVYDMVMDACMEQNVDVLATSFDGECFSLLTEDKEGNPLTLINLQHKVFDQVRKLDKRQIIKDIILRSKTTGKEKEKLKEMNETYLKSGKIFVSSVVLPKKPYIELHKAIAVNLKMKENARKRSANNGNDSTLGSESSSSTESKVDSSGFFSAENDAGNSSRTSKSDSGAHSKSASDSAAKGNKRAKSNEEQTATEQPK